MSSKEPYMTIMGTRSRVVVWRSVIVPINLWGLGALQYSVLGFNVLKEFCLNISMSSSMSIISSNWTLFLMKLTQRKVWIGEQDP